MLLVNVVSAIVDFVAKLLTGGGQDWA